MATSRDNLRGLVVHPPVPLPNEGPNERYMRDPVAFTEDVFATYFEEAKRGLDTWQKEVMWAVAEYSHVAVTGANNVGKSAVAAWLQWWFLCTRVKPIVPVTSVSQHQLINVLWTESRRWYDRSSDLQKAFFFHATSINHKSSDTWYSKAIVARQETDRTAGGRTVTAGLQGLHNEHLLFILDEASNVADPNWEAAESSIRSENHKIFAISNPLRLQGRLFEIFHLGRFKKYWYTRQVSFRESSNMNSGKAKEMAEQEIQALGPESPVVQIRYEGKFPKLGGEDTLPSYQDVLDAMMRSRDADEEAVNTLLNIIEEHGEDVIDSEYNKNQLRAYAEKLDRQADGIASGIIGQLDYSIEPLYRTVVNLPTTDTLMKSWQNITSRYFSGPCRMGVDLARFGGNETVFCVRRGYRVVEMKGYHGLKQQGILGHIKMAFVRFPDLEVAIVDKTGLAGDMAIADPLIEEGYSIVTVGFGESSTKPDKYANIASEMWLDDIAGNIKQLLLPSDDMLLSQLTTRPYEPSGKTETQLKIAPKQKMAISPDRADSVGLAFCKVEIADINEYDDDYEDDYEEPTVTGEFHL